MRGVATLAGMNGTDVWCRYADCPGTPSESSTCIRSDLTCSDPVLAIRIDSQTILDFACHHAVLSPTAKVCILFGA